MYIYTINVIQGIIIIKYSGPGNMILRERSIMKDHYYQSPNRVCRSKFTVDVQPALHENTRISKVEKNWMTIRDVIRCQRTYDLNGALSAAVGAYIDITTHQCVE